MSTSSTEAAMPPVCVLGLGLIGGSLLRASRAAHHRLRMVTQ